MTISHQPSIKKKPRAAFTLIELLMVIVVIVILMGLLLPVLVPSREKAKERQRRLGQKTLAAALLTYHHEYMSWPNPAAGGANGAYREENFRVLDEMNSGDVRIINPGDYARDEQGSIRCADGYYYGIMFSNDMAYVWNFESERFESVYNY